MLALWIHVLLIVAVLAGIAWHCRWRATLTFPLYLLLGAGCGVLEIAGAIGPEDWLLWLLVELSQKILVLGVAVEIGARIFHRGLPGGRTYTGRVFVAVLGLGLLAALAWGRALGDSPSDHELYFALVAGSRRVALTATAAFTLLGFMVVSWFDWPLDPYHHAVGAGFLIYQWVFVLLMPWPEAAPILPQVWPVWVYGAALVVWARAAWRPVDALGLEPETRALVLPWQKVTS